MSKHVRRLLSLENGKEWKTGAQIRIVFIYTVDFKVKKGCFQ